MSESLSRALVLAACVASCRMPEQREVVHATPTAVTAAPLATAPPAAAAAPESKPRALGVVATNVPDALVLDGSLEEWRAPNDTARAVYVAVASDKLVIAAPLPASELWLALAAPAPQVPEIGWVERGGGVHEITDERCQFEQVSLPEANWEHGKQHPPEVVAACRALVKRRDDFVASYHERFVRRFVLTESSIATVDPSGRRQPIADALHRADGGIEVQLPLAAMPALAEAPLTTLLGAVSEGAPAQPWLAPRMDDDGWEKLRLPRPVGFEPFAGARSAVLADQANSYVMRSDYLITYHPAEPETIEVVQASTPDTSPGSLGSPAPNRQVVIVERRAFVTPLDELGDIKIGVVNAHVHALVTHRQGALVGMVRVGDVRGVKRHEDELHVFTYDAAGFTWTVGTYLPPHWQVVAVKADGQLDANKADEGVDMMGIWNAWDDDPVAFSDPDFKRFGMHGKRNKRPKMVTWQWDAKAGLYVSQVKPANQAAGLIP